LPVKKVVITTCLLALAAGFLFWKSTAVRALFFSSGPSAETRGYHLAQELGCFYCHATNGSGGIPNPGSPDEAIPSWQGFSFMMSMKDEGELREWILDGVPQRIAETQTYRQKTEKMAVPMPAYRGEISESELDHLVAFYHGVSGTIWPGEAQAEKGLLAAQEAGCFACHGFAGRVDVPNPGSFAGRIPAWHGADFQHLVRNEAELREWILDGVAQRIANHPVASYYMDRQTLEMPAYRGALEPPQIDAIIAYINWLRDPNALGHQLSFSY